MSLAIEGIESKETTRGNVENLPKKIKFMLQNSKPYNLQFITRK